MTWYWWLITGVALGITLVIAFVYTVDTVRYRRQQRRRAVSEQRTAAERQMQSIVQDTITELFRNARGVR